MSFERYSPNAPSWDQTPPPIEALPFQRDPRIHDVLNEIEYLEAQPRPPAIDEMRWFVLLRDLRHIAENWLDIALALDWSLLDLFGSPPLMSGRAGLMGVAVLLRGRSIESIDHQRVVIANRLGPPNIFRRPPPGSDQAGAELVWNVIAKGEIT